MKKTNKKVVNGSIRIIDSWNNIVEKMHYDYYSNGKTEMRGLTKKEIREEK